MVFFLPFTSDGCYKSMVFFLPFTMNKNKKVLACKFRKQPYMKKKKKKEQIDNFNPFTKTLTS